MGNLVISVVWIILIVSIVKKRILKSNSDIVRSQNRINNMKNGINKNEYSGPNIDKSSLANPSFKKGSILSLMDDREHDWMAQQLAEEHRAFKRTSAMFDLKYEHAMSCDAKINASMHRQECDAGEVDKGAVK